MILDEKDCKKNFEVYEKKEVDKSGGTTSYMIMGTNSNKKGHLHKEIDEFGSFENKPIKIPKGYKKVTEKRRNQYVNDWACKKRKTRKQKDKLKDKLKGSLSWNSWYDKSRKHWLTLKDFKAMKKDAKVIVLLLHRNALDAPMTKFKENTPYRPEIFFKSEKKSIVYKGNMNVVLNKESEPWGLDIEYKKDKWYPLSEGYLHKGKKKHWSEFSKNTAVGYRGPLILWSDLKKLPSLYFS